MTGKSAMQTISYSDDPSDRLMELFTTLGRMNSLRDPLASMVEAMGFTPPQLHAVMWVGKEGRLTMGVLAQRLGVTEKTVTGIVDRLEAAGYARRVRDSADRRVVMVELEQKGLGAYRDLDAEVRRKLVMFLSLLDPADQNALFRILEQLLEKLSSRAPRSAGHTSDDDKTSP